MSQYDLSFDAKLVLILFNILEQSYYTNSLHNTNMYITRKTKMKIEK